jgi:transcriptional regulator with XRE-family HTH domain
MGMTISHMGTMHYMAAPKGKAAGSEEAGRVRAIVRELCESRYDGNRTRAAEALHVSQPTLSELLNGKAGPGFQLLERLRELTGKCIDEMLYGQPCACLVRGDGMLMLRGGAVAGMLVGWEDAEANARALEPDVPGWAWEAARVMSVPAGARASAELAADLAFVAWRHTGADERARAEAAAIAKAGQRLRGAARPRGDA